MTDAEYVCPHCNTFNSKRPSSKPKSSPFAPQEEFESSAPTEPTAEAPQPPAEKRSRASLPSEATQLPWQAQSTGVDETQTKRRSARLRATHSPPEKASESMELLSLIHI